MQKSNVKKAMSVLASFGGKATLKKHGKAHFRKIQKLSVIAKKKKTRI